MMEPMIGILRNENPESSQKWEQACKDLKIEYDVIDITRNDWLERSSGKPYSFFLTKPPGEIERYKILYDERLYVLNKILGYKVFPSYEECLIYENKKMLSYFLKAKNIPHPNTSVFYDFDEAYEYISNVELPIVAKTSIGAAGCGVKILHNLSEAKIYLRTAFKGNGIRKRFGPNRVTGNPKKWISKAIIYPGMLKKKWKQYIERYKDSQRGYVILQEFIEHDFEWRVARIGESYFAYKKMRVNEKASGAKNIVFENPPLDILEFVRKISDENDIRCAAFDIFVSKRGNLINEVQTLFGHIKDHILEVDGVPGRYVYNENDWVFEPGCHFNINESYNYRLKTALDYYSRGLL